MVNLSNDEKQRIIDNAREQLEQVIDPVDRSHLKGFIAGVWCCMDD